MRVELTLDEIKEEEVNILKILMRFLNKNDIKYSIGYGTFLGAVRHKGFIPWDDDIDLIIPRPDYEKLLKILRKDNYIDKNIKGIGFELGNEDWPFLKIISEKVKVEQVENCDKNLWIDIFPLDGVPKKVDKYVKKINFFKNIYFLKKEQVKKLSNNEVNILKKIIKKIIKGILIFVPYTVIIKHYIKVCTAYEYSESVYVRNNVWSDYEDALRKEIVTDFKLYKFEGLEVNGIKEYDEYLKAMYGNDYMQLPPVDKRVTHNFKAWRINNEK